MISIYDKFTKNRVKILANKMLFFKTKKPILISEVREEISR